MTERGWFTGRNVLVTGAAGVLGSRLVHALLESKLSVIGWLRDEDDRSPLFQSGDSRRIIRVSGPLDDVSTLERVLVRHSVSAVFHLAAQTQVQHADRFPLGALESNVRATYLLLEACRRVGGVESIVVASSDKAYGEGAALPYVESHPLKGRNIYDASKSAADTLATAYAATYGMPIGIARCANIYGPGDLNWDRIVPGTIRSLLQGDRPVIRSDGTPRRDYIHVDDAVDAYLRLARDAGRFSGEAFNFGAGRGIGVLELVSRIAAAVGRADLLPDVRADARNELSDQWLDSTKAQRHLGWVPTVSLDDGLLSTVDWYREILS